jgi:hypothetical protein
VTKICGFGLAKNVGDESEGNTQEVTQASDLLGSPRYMSPEQARNPKDVDVRTDIWSLGASLYHALTGERPWAGHDGLTELLIQLQIGELPHVQDRAPWISRELAEVVHRALERDVDARFQTMDEFAAALAAAVPLQDVPLGEVGPLPPEVRRQRHDRAAARAAPAPRIVRSEGPPPTASPRQLARRKRASQAVMFLGVVLGVALLTAVGGFAIYRSRTQAVAPPSTSAQPSTHVAWVEITPAEATVTVDGAPQTLESGRLRLEGPSGSRFRVVARHGAQSLETNVVVTRKGSAAPPRIQLDDPAADEPATDEPATDEPATDEPATDEPATDEPATDAVPPEEPAPVDSAPKRTAPKRAAPKPTAPKRTAPPQPAPTQPAPTQPAPSAPAPSQPAPTQPAPTQPAPTQPAPTQPAPSQPAPGDTAPGN